MTIEKKHASFILSLIIFLFAIIASLCYFAFYYIGSINGDFMSIFSADFFKYIADHLANFSTSNTLLLDCLIVYVPLIGSFIGLFNRFARWCGLISLIGLVTPIVTYILITLISELSFESFLSFANSAETAFSLIFIFSAVNLILNFINLEKSK